MSNLCVDCGSPIPDGQRTCSMCYGDIDHGKDGFYREWAEERVRRSMEEVEREADREAEEWENET